MTRSLIAQIFWGNNSTSGGRPRLGSVAAALGMLGLWHERARQRRVLRRLDPDLLRDIGITRTQARAEVGKPFWRA